MVLSSHETAEREADEQLPQSGKWRGGILSVCSVPASAAFRQALGDGGDVSRLCFCQVSLYFAMSADPSYARRGKDCQFEKFRRTAPEIISELRKAVQDRETIVIQPGIEVGEEVNVVAGPFRGLRAVVSRVMPARERVAVLLEVLGMEREVEVSFDTVIVDIPHPMTRGAAQQAPQ